MTIDEILHFNLNPILLLHGTNASNKQGSLVKSLTSAWEKKNSKVARAGGVSLMALTLAACGGSDDTPTSGCIQHVMSSCVCFVMILQLAFAPLIPPHILQ